MHSFLPEIVNLSQLPATPTRTSQNAAHPCTWLCVQPPLEFPRPFPLPQQLLVIQILPGLLRTPFSVPLKLGGRLSLLCRPTRFRRQNTFISSFAGDLSLAGHLLHRSYWSHRHSQQAKWTANGAWLQKTAGSQPQWRRVEQEQQIQARFSTCQAHSGGYALTGAVWHQLYVKAHAGKYSSSVSSMPVGHGTWYSCTNEDHLV